MDENASYLDFRLQESRNGQLVSFMISTRRKRVNASYQTKFCNVDLGLSTLLQVTLICGKAIMEV